MADILLEICCGSVADVVAAEAGGADRVELCSALFLGGLTPSAGSLQQAKYDTSVPVMAMVRPRPAGFCYSRTDFAVMERDTDLLIENHANGIVIGILKDDRTIDATRCKQLVNRAQGREVVFHRAFDLVPNPIRALDELIGLGFTRVLTSGQQATASAGAALVRKLVDYADARIQILPGSGIRPQNVKALLVATGCSQVHATAFRVREDPTTATTHLKFGSTANSSESNYDGTEAELVRELRRAIDRV